MKIFWPNKISNKDLHNITNTKDMETLLIQKRWSWLGHVLRKPSEDMTKVVLRWTPEGKRKRGRPKTTWRRTIENEIKERGYTWGTIERKANNRDEWRKLALALCAMRHSKGQNCFSYTISSYTLTTLGPAWASGSFLLKNKKKT